MKQANDNKMLSQGSLTALMVLLALTFMTYGCAGPKENTALISARSTYMLAKADPNVVESASVALYEAGKLLNSAENAETDIKMSHLAYMAKKQTQIALAIADKKAAEFERQSLAGDTNKILLQHEQQQTLKASSRAEAASQRAEAAEQELAALQAKKTDRGFVLTLGDVLFATGKADLMSGTQRTIDNLAAFLNKYPEKNVSIEGHTDSTGSESFNMMLSQSRADSVGSALMARGISSDCIIIKGLGEIYPVASNDNAAGRQQNRRVEIIISSAL